MSLPAPQAAAVLCNVIDYMNENSNCSTHDIKRFIETGMQKHLCANACANVILCLAAFVDEMLPGAGLPGLDTTLMNQHVKSSINMWLVHKMGLAPLYFEEKGIIVETPLAYTNLSEVPDVVNFFERFNTSYQSGACGNDIVEW